MSTAQIHDVKLGDQLRINGVEFHITSMETRRELRHNGAWQCIDGLVESRGVRLVLTGMDEELLRHHGINTTKPPISGSHKGTGAEGETFKNE